MKTPGLARRHSTLWISTALLTALGGMTGCEDSGGIVGTDTAVLQMSPQEFVFPRLAMGARAEREVRLDNLSEGVLKIAGLAGEFRDASDYSLYYYVTAGGADAAAGDEAPRQLVAIDRGAVTFPQVVDIPGHGSLIFVLEYAASDDEGANGAITFESNDPDNRFVRVPIRGAEGGAEINIAPRTIDFGRVAAGDSATEIVTITNIGSAPLFIQDIAPNGSPDFSARINGVDLTEDAGPLADPDGDGEPGLSDGASFELEVIYAPEVDGPDAGEITVASNDPQRPVDSIELTANGASPCIRVNPDSVEFPATLTGRTVPRPVTIESCGGQPLEITAIYLADDSAPVYALDEASVPDLPTQLPAFVQGEAPPTRQVNVEFTPEDTAAYGGKVIIESNDPLHPRLEVPIVGRGTLNDCPVAAVGMDTFDVLPLDIVELDGSASTDADGPGGTPVRYEWTVIERPDGSTQDPAERFQDPRNPSNTALPDDLSTPNAFFFVDLAGRYVISLRVMDNNDVWAPSEVCPQPDAVVVIEAHPNQDIHVQMVWTTPGDRDNTDGEGSDVDMHLLHPRGRAWAQAPLDCYYANGNPDWGPPGPPGNPSLDIDDVNGAGPENINLDEPEDTAALGGQYRVGIDYYRAENFAGGGTWGPSEVTVRIFLGGVQAGEWVRVMQATHHFWEVASIIWTAADRRVQVINRYYNSVP